MDHELKKASAAAAGYTVAYSGVISGWGCRWSEDSGPNAEWGWNNEWEAWEAAFAHLCRTQVVYRHKKGGIYMQLMEGKLTSMTPAVAAMVGGEPVMIYKHLAPHEPGVWVRPLAEFNEEGRFVRIAG